MQKTTCTRFWIDSIGYLWAGPWTVPIDGLSFAWFNGFRYDNQHQQMIPEWRMARKRARKDFQEIPFERVNKIVGRYLLAAEHERLFGHLPLEHGNTLPTDT